MVSSTRSDRIDAHPSTATTRERSISKLLAELDRADHLSQAKSVASPQRGAKPLVGDMRNREGYWGMQTCRARDMAEDLPPQRIPTVEHLEIYSSSRAQIEKFEREAWQPAMSAAAPAMAIATTDLDSIQAGLTTSANGAAHCSGQTASAWDGPYVYRTFAQGVSVYGATGEQLRSCPTAQMDHSASRSRAQREEDMDRQNERRLVLLKAEAQAREAFGTRPVALCFRLSA